MLNLFCSNTIRALALKVPGPEFCLYHSVHILAHKLRYLSLIQAEGLLRVKEKEVERLARSLEGAKTVGENGALQQSKEVTGAKEAVKKLEGLLSICRVRVTEVRDLLNVSLCLKQI